MELYRRILKKRWNLDLWFYVNQDWIRDISFAGALFSAYLGTGAFGLIAVTIVYMTVELRQKGKKLKRKGS